MVYMILENVDGVTGFWLSSWLPLIEVPTREEVEEEVLGVGAEVEGGEMP
jgi:hypothetical protein